MQQCRPLCSAQLPGGLGPKPRSQSRVKMDSLLQRMKATKLADAPSSVQQSLVISDETFLSAEEQASFSSEQLAFLVRKRKAAAGLGPIMPVESMCPCCDGRGLLVCHQCNGSGANSEDMAEKIFQKEGVIKVNNGLVEARWMFMQHGPCWLCRGKTEMSCRDCSGTGIRGGVDRFSGD